MEDSRLIAAEKKSFCSYGGKGRKQKKSPIDEDGRTCHKLFVQAQKLREESRLGSQSYKLQNFLLALWKATSFRTSVISVGNLSAEQVSDGRLAREEQQLQSSRELLSVECSLEEISQSGEKDLLRKDQSRM